MRLSRPGITELAAAATLGLALLSGCAPHPELPPAPAGRALAESEAVRIPLLWRAEAPADAGRSVFHLLGSVHVGAPTTGNLGPAVAEVFEGCDELVVEVDLSALSEVAIAEETAKHALLPAGRTLRDTLAPDTYARLEARLSERGASIQAVERLQPWAVSTLLTTLEFQTAGLDPEHGVDRLLIDEAAGARPIRGLETLSSQLTMMSGLSPAVQNLMVLDALGRSEEIEGQAMSLLDAWERGDEAALAALLFGPLEEHPELHGFYEAVFFARNEVMAEQLAALAHDGRRRLVVLGAGHLVGPRGIPALLRSRGFRVERVGMEPLSPRADAR